MKGYYILPSLSIALFAVGKPKVLWKRGFSTFQGSFNSIFGLHILLSILGSRSIPKDIAMLQKSRNMNERQASGGRRSGNFFKAPSSSLLSGIRIPALLLFSISFLFSLLLSELPSLSHKILFRKPIMKFSHHPRPRPASGYCKKGK